MRLAHRSTLKGLAKMLFQLGLRRFPPVDVLLGIAAGRPPTNERALRYLLDKFQSQYVTFDANAFSGVPFIPSTSPTGHSVLAKPGEVSPDEIEPVDFF